MENSNTKKKFVIIVICLSVLILGMGSYIIVDCINDRNVKECVANPEINNTQNLFSNYILNISNSMLKMNKDFGQYKDTGLEEGIEDEKITVLNHDDYLLKDIIDVEIEYNQDVYVNIIPNTELYEKYGAKHKLKSDVIDAEICNIGNGGYAYIYLVNKDGTISYVDSVKLYENNLIEVVQLDKFKDIINIVQVTEFESTKVVVIDVYGNMYDLSK